MKAPKRYKCLECGSKSSRSKTLHVGGIGFARCFKCKGRVTETEEWLNWYNEETKKWLESLNG